MRIRIHAAAYALAGGLCGGLLDCPAPAQDNPGHVEVVPAPPATPGGTPRAYRPNATYAPWQARQDAYRADESERRRAINRPLGNRPLGAIDDVRRYRTWSPYVYRYALPYIYAYAPPGVAGRVHRNIERYGRGRVLTPWPPAPGNVDGHPSHPQTRQPLGPGQIGSGPNGYLYRPRYAPPARPQNVPTPAAPSTRPQQPAVELPPEPTVGPALVFPPGPAPEPVPPPPAESGPREF